MEPIILNDIPFRPDVGLLKERLRVRDGRYADDLVRLVAAAQAVARPRAVFKVAFVEERGDDWVVVDGVRLTSRVLRVNLDQAQRVLPFVATCGVELDEWSRTIDDVLQRYWADAILETALSAALRALDERLVEQAGPTSSMAPGSLEDWPLAEQRPLFAILGDVEGAVGVRLTEGLMMTPVKSLSGLHFATEEGFASCQLCQREGCPGRRAPYDAGLYERKYRA